MFTADAAPGSGARTTPRRKGGATSQLRTYRRTVFGPGLLGAPGCGATQAAAGTAPEGKEPRKARYRSSICEAECPGFGGELYGWTGYCCG